MLFKKYRISKLDLNYNFYPGDTIRSLDKYKIRYKRCDYNTVIKTIEKSLYHTEKYFILGFGTGEILLTKVRFREPGFLKNLYITESPVNVYQYINNIKKDKVKYIIKNYLQKIT
jgi:hypothetical protein